jgi:hypothetical protein
MNGQSFHARAIKWLRIEQNLRTSTLPHDKLIEDASGGARIEGFFARRSTAGTWAFVGLCGAALGAILAMGRLPGAPAKIELALHWSGYAAQAAGLVCWLIAEVIRRRSRKRALVELRTASSVPTPASVEALRKASGEAETWIVAEARLPEDVVRRAAEHAVRCFSLQDGRFCELRRARAGAEPPNSPPAIAQQSSLRRAAAQ